MHTNDGVSGIDAIELPSRVARQETILSMQLEWIRGVDNKGSLVIGLATAMLAMVAAVTPARAELTCPNIFTALVGATAPMLCVLWCGLASFPHTHGPSGSMVYFGTIASRPFPAYAKAASEQSEREYLVDLVAQCHRNAQIAACKYKHIGRGLLALFVGVPVWLICCYFLYKG